jgi:hypothetical protein
VYGNDGQKVNVSKASVSEISVEDPNQMIVEIIEGMPGSCSRPYSYRKIVFHRLGGAWFRVPGGLGGIGQAFLIKLRQNKNISREGWETPPGKKDVDTWVHLPDNNGVWSSGSPG